MNPTVQEILDHVVETDGENYAEIQQKIADEHGYELDIGIIRAIKESLN